MSFLVPLSISFTQRLSRDFSTTGKHVHKAGSLATHFVTHYTSKSVKGFYLPLVHSKDWAYDKVIDFFQNSKIGGGNLTEVDVSTLDIKIVAPGGPSGNPTPSAPIEGPQSGANAAILPSFQPISDVISKIQKKALAALPFFLIALYRSKEEHLQNVNLKIKASSHPKVYQIGLGLQNGNELSCAFEILAGKKICFLREKEAFTSSILPKAIFKPSSSLISKAIGPFKHLIWKRQDAYTSCNIIIEDEGNPLLKNGPLTAFIQVSDRESFYILHKDPNVTHDNADASDFVIRPQDSQFASFKALSLTVSDPLSPNEEHHKQIIPLNFDEKRQDQYVSIRQWQ